MGDLTQRIGSERARELSVTLKMADQDAKLVGDILDNVAKLQGAALEGKETVHQLQALDRLVSSHVMVKRVIELTGAFRVVTRANER